MRVVLVFATFSASIARWCQLENVKQDTQNDYTYIGPWRLDTCTTLTLDHGKCTEAECPYRIKFGDDEIIELADAMHGNTVLTALSLGSNKLSDESAKALAEVLRDNEALTDLHLQGNQISDDGAVALAQVLQENPVLTTLNLEHNIIGDEGGQAILDVLQSNTSALDTVHLSHNDVSPWILSTIAAENDRMMKPPEEPHGGEI